MNLGGTCRREGVDVRFLSFAELLAEGLGLLDREPMPGTETGSGAGAGNAAGEGRR